MKATKFCFGILAAASFLILALAVEMANRHMPARLDQSAMATLMGGSGFPGNEKLAPPNSCFTNCYGCGGHGCVCTEVANTWYTSGGNRLYTVTTGVLCNPVIRYTWPWCSGNPTDIGNCQTTKTTAVDP